MHFRFPKVPGFIKWFFPTQIWEIPTKKPELYLTFDDGPHPEITPWVLDQLYLFDVTATFFLLGKNAEQYPEIVQQIVEGGHAVGNHSFSHLNGWKTKDKTYIEDAKKAANVVSSSLFRPPYGKITPSQVKKLHKDYRIIMWSVLSYDFDAQTKTSTCLEMLKRYSSPGSIIVFHDSEKAWPRLREVLPQYLEWLKENGLKSSRIQ